MRNNKILSVFRSALDKLDPKVDVLTRWRSVALIITVTELA